MISTRVTINNQSPPHRVRFPEEPADLVTFHPCVPLLSELTLEDHEALWFQPEEFARFRQTARLIARECRKYGYGGSLSKCYKDTPESIVALEHWSRYAHARRGIERWCNAALGKLRKAQQRDCIRIVLETQDEIRQVNGFSSRILPKNNKNNNDDWQIADVYSRSVQSSRRFALKMGMADALAVLPVRPDHDPSRAALLSRISQTVLENSTSNGTNPSRRHMTFIC